MRHIMDYFHLPLGFSTNALIPFCCPVSLKGSEDFILACQNISKLNGEPLPYLLFLIQDQDLGRMQMVEMMGDKGIRVNGKKDGDSCIALRRLILELGWK